MCALVNHEACLAAHTDIACWAFAPIKQSLQLPQSAEHYPHTSFCAGVRYQRHRMGESNHIGCSETAEHKPALADSTERTTTSACSSTTTNAPAEIVQAMPMNNARYLQPTEMSTAQGYQQEHVPRSSSHRSYQHTFGNTMNFATIGCCLL